MDRRKAADGQMELGDSYNPWGGSIVTSRMQSQTISQPYRIFLSLLNMFLNINNRINWINCIYNAPMSGEAPGTCPYKKGKISVLKL